MKYLVIESLYPELDFFWLIHHDVIMMMSFANIVQRKFTILINKFDSFHSEATVKYILYTPTLEFDWLTFYTHVYELESLSKL